MGENDPIDEFIHEKMTKTLRVKMEESGSQEHISSNNFADFAPQGRVFEPFLFSFSWMNP